MTEETDAVPWQPSRLRRINARALWDRLRADGRTSRAELSRRTGLSKPTVSAALANLTDAGLVRPAGTHTPAGRGRTAVLYEPDPGAGYVVGVDIGRGTVHVAVADLAADIVARRDVPNRTRSGAALAGLVVDTARGTVADAGLSWTQVERVAIGTPGAYDETTDRVRYAVNLPGWGRPGVLAGLRAELGAHVELHNDANLAALAEYSAGVGAGSRLFLYVWIGTGLGLGIVSDGRLFLGAGRAAGEIGFLPMAPRLPAAGTSRRPDERTDADRRSGVLEEVTGRRPGILEQAVNADSVVRTAHALGMAGPLTARQVFAEARAGTEPARTAVLQEAERIAHVVASVTAVLDPDLIALGGTVGVNADLLLDPVRRSVHRLIPLRPKVVVATLPDAVLHGTVTIALDRAREEVFSRRTAALPH